jgi:probable rRNA maturation factor
VPDGALLFAFAIIYSGFENQPAYAYELVMMQKSVAGLSAEALARFVTLASRTVKLRGGANVLVTGNRAMQVLNTRFRRQKRATDVLSFPTDPALSHGGAGDIAISADIARQNARQLGHSAAQEVKILALHGLLHLAGYDHEQDNGEMARQEQRMRKMLGLPLGLIERKAPRAESRKAQNAHQGSRSASRAPQKLLSKTSQTLR